MKAFSALHPEPRWLVWVDVSVGGSQALPEWCLSLFLINRALHLTLDEKEKGFSGKKGGRNVHRTRHKILGGFQGVCGVWVKWVEGRPGLYLWAQFRAEAKT